MNQPLRKIGQHDGRAVYDLNGRNHKFDRGFTPTVVYLGSYPGTGSETGTMVPRFAPTRRQRRASLQKKNNCQHFGYHVRHWQYVSDKAGKLKAIPHFRTGKAQTDGSEV